MINDNTNASHDRQKLTLTLSSDNPPAFASALTISSSFVIVVPSKMRVVPDAPWSKTSSAFCVKVAIETGPHGNGDAPGEIVIVSDIVSS